MIVTHHYSEITFLFRLYAKGYSHGHAVEPQTPLKCGVGCRVVHSHAMIMLHAMFYIFMPCFKQSIYLCDALYNYAMFYISICHILYIFMPCFIYLSHVLYIYAMFYIFTRWFTYLCHVLSIYAMFYIFMSISIHVASLFIYAATRFPYLLHCLISFMVYQHKFMLHHHVFTRFFVKRLVFK